VARTVVDEYLDTVAPVPRATLEKLRRDLHSLLPGVEECTYYGLPAFRHDGVVLAGFSAGKKFCSYYPMSGSVLDRIPAAAHYEQTKGSLHFDHDRPLSKALVHKMIIERRRVELEKRAKKVKQ
jgi:uncharacterized protein YdhG (YjbR/CyaY superfamily)